MHGAVTGSRAHGAPVAWAALATVLLLPGCVGFDCENAIKQQVTSPDGTLKAVVFDRGCGATTGFNTQVSILDVVSALADDGGNTLILDDTIALQLRWNSNKTLTITGGRASPHIFRQEQWVGGIRVTYTN